MQDEFERSHFQAEEEGDEHPKKVFSDDEWAEDTEEEDEDEEKDTDTDEEEEI